MDQKNILERRSGIIFIFRKIERDSLPVIDDSWFHQFQAKMLLEFYKLQRAVGIGGNSEIEEEKLVQVDRDWARSEITHTLWLSFIFFRTVDIFFHKTFFE